MIKTLMFTIALQLTGCTTSTQYGKCIGLIDKEDPAFSYEINVLNAFVSVLFFETVIVPVVWGISQAKCPTGVTNVPAK